MDLEMRLNRIMQEGFRAIDRAIEQVIYKHEKADGYVDHLGGICVSTGLATFRTPLTYKTEPNLNNVYYIRDYR